jgi:hypothetical protein
MESIAKHFKIQWPQREAKPASEFVPGFFSKAFPDLFPDGKGDLTKPRLGKNPSEKEYFKHLMRLSRSFVEHHCFTFVATNMLRRHEALTRGNVFSKHCAEALTISELKAAVEAGNDKVIKKLLYFAAPIPGTRQYLRYKTDQAVSLVKYLRISSNDQEMFNFFQTFSAADLHWDDLHRLLPDSEKYLGKRLVDALEQVPEEERPGCIEKTEDAKLRIANLKKHADIVDWYFYHRVQSLLKHVLPVIGAQHWICRYEVQARGTIHVHILLHVSGGPSHSDLQLAYQRTASVPPDMREEAKAAQEKIVGFATKVLGISAVHPNPSPPMWPAPFGQNVHTPSSNCLRNRFLELDTLGELEAQYEKLINRCMLHHCRVGYCLSEQRKDSDGKMLCRFNFPVDLHGFKEVFNEEGTHLLAMERGGETASDSGADFVDGKLRFLRNHPTLVHHVPELLLLWGANIEGRPVQSYQQVLRYLLKYMMKDEPNSAPFQAICKAVVEASKDEEPVRRAFQKILMKTVGEHDLSKQECHHILNGLDFVEFSDQFVNVNVMGTRRVNPPPLNDEGQPQPALQDNLAMIYWNRESDPNYQQAVDLHRQGTITWDPHKVNLYNFASRFTKKWVPLAGSCVPHITPNFNFIPKKDSFTHGRYAMFLRTILLTHRCGTRLQDVIDLAVDALENEVATFLQTEECPPLVREEYRESQRGTPEEAEEVRFKMAITLPFSKVGTYVCSGEYLCSC